MRLIGIRIVNIHVEAGGVYICLIKDSMISFCKSFCNYEPELIYKEDESGIVFQMLPNVSSLAPKEEHR